MNDLPANQDLKEEIYNTQARWIAELEAQNKALLEALAKPHQLNASPSIVISDPGKYIANQAAEIQRLKAMLRTLTSIPVICDLEKRIDSDGFSSHNPVTDAREMSK